MNKKRYFYSIVFIILLVAACPTARGLDLPPELEDWLSQKDSLVAGIESDVPPFGFVNRRGEPDGFDVDVALHMGRLLGKRIVFRLGSRGELLDAISKGDVDFIAGIDKVSELDKQLLFSRRMLVDEYKLYIPADSREVSGVSELNGQRIGYRTGSPVAKFFGEALKIELVQFNSPLKGLEETAEHNIDGFIGSRHICDYIIILNKLQDKISINNNVTLKYDYCMAVSVSHPELMKILDTALVGSENEAVFKDIIGKWFEHRRYRSVGNGPIAWVFIAVLLIAVVIIFALVYIKQRAVMAFELERRRSEGLEREVAELRNIRKRFDELLSSAGLGLFVLGDTEDGEGRFLAVNEGLADLTGYDEKALLKMGIDELFSKEEFEKIIRRYRLRRAGEPQPEAYESIGIRADGESVPVELFVETVSSSEGLLTIGLLRDISRTKALQNKLRRSDQNFRAMLSGLPQGAIVINRERIIYVNNAFRRLVGRAPEDIRAFGIEKLVTPIHRTRIERFIDGLLSGKEVSKEIDLEIMHKDGSLVSTTTRPRLISYFGEPAVLLIFENLTEENRLRKRLGIESRVEGLGRVAEHVVLEYNNTLMGILGAVSQIRGETPVDSPLVEYIDIIEKDAERAALLTGKLLAFSKSTEKSRGEVLSLNSILKDAIELLPKSEGRPIEIQTEFAARPDTTFGNLSQVHQAILNLMVNAVEAMKGGGTLTLRTGNIKLDAALKARFPDAKHSRYVFVEVSDTGPGIEPKLIDNIFEPFFTTKEIGAGAGLGLSLVYKIAKRHEGFVDVDSELGKGSKFTLFLPEKIAESREASTSNALPRGNETILIVDDEPHVRTVLRALLSKLGYEVLLVSDGEEAVETVRSHGDEIDLVLLDVVMPGMNGPEVFDAIRSLKPDCKVVISTGYAKEETVGDLIRQGAAALVRKPYRAATLSTVIRRVLDEEDNDGQIYG